MLSVTSLCKKYIGKAESVSALVDATFCVPRGKVFTLLGPSGCGKTTLLRCLAGLETPDDGEIRINGKLIFSGPRNVFVSPSQRNFGMVFQSYAIWPHMTVYENVRFPLDVRRPRLMAAELDAAVRRVLDVVGLGKLSQRPATQLSGGQQQRLALARAVVNGPPLLLLDEPLSNLDAKLRERMRFELKRLQEELKLTMVYVTHDQTEALALSHEIAVMNAGKIVQIGSPRDIYDRPQNRFVADFVGATNLVPGRVRHAGGADELHTVDLGFGSLSVNCPERACAGATVVVSIRPEHIQLSTERIDAPAVFQGTMKAQLFVGEHQDLQIGVGKTLLRARVPAFFDAAIGRSVHIAIDQARCMAFVDVEAPVSPAPTNGECDD